MKNVFIVINLIVIVFISACSSGGSSDPKNSNSYFESDPDNGENEGGEDNTDAADDDGTDTETGDDTVKDDGGDQDDDGDGDGGDGGDGGDDEDGPIIPPPITTYTVSGRVTLLGDGLPGVQMVLERASNYQIKTITDASGYFIFENVYKRSDYTLYSDSETLSWVQDEYLFDIEDNDEEDCDFEVVLNWIKFYEFADGFGDIVINSIIQAQDSRYIATGYKKDIGSPLNEEDIVLFSLDQYGEIVSTSSFEGNESDIGVSVKELNDASFVVGARTASFSGAPFESSGENDAVLMHLDNQLNLETSVVLGSVDNDVLLNMDLYYINTEPVLFLTGSTNIGSDYPRPWLVKMVKNSGGWGSEINDPNFDLDGYLYDSDESSQFEKLLYYKDQDLTDNYYLGNNRIIDNIGIGVSDHSIVTLNSSYEISAPLSRPDIQQDNRFADMVKLDNNEIVYAVNIKNTAYDSILLYDILDNNVSEVLLINSSVYPLGDIEVVSMLRGYENQLVLCIKNTISVKSSILIQVYDENLILDNEKIFDLSSSDSTIPTSMAVTKDNCVIIAGYVEGPPRRAFLIKLDRLFDYKPVNYDNTSFVGVEF
jgi:hypothetical protein